MWYLVKHVQNQQNCQLNIFKQYITQSYRENEAFNETCSKQVNNYSNLLKTNKIVIMIYLNSTLLSIMGEMKHLMKHVQNKSTLDEFLFVYDKT